MKLPRYNNNAEECRYEWQENEPADFWQWLLRQLLLLAREGGGGKRPGSSCGTALLFNLIVTYQRIIHSSTDFYNVTKS